MQCFSACQHVCAILSFLTRSRYLRMVMVQFHTPDTAVDFQGDELPNQPFFRVTEWTVFARCSCNGHSSVCIVSDEGQLV